MGTLTCQSESWSDRHCPILFFSVSVPHYQSIPFIIVMHRPRISIISFPIAASNIERAHTHVGVQLGIGHLVRQMQQWGTVITNTLQTATMRGWRRECGRRARVSMYETRGFCNNWCSPAGIAPISCSVVGYARVLVLATYIRCRRMWRWRMVPCWMARISNIGIPWTGKGWSGGGPGLYRGISRCGSLGGLGVINPQLLNSG